MNRTLPAIGAARGLPVVATHVHSLANGLRVVVVERRELPMINLEIVFPRGAELDLPDWAGRASMLAEMLDEGTPSRSAFAIAEEIDYLGAHLGVDAGFDATTVSLNVMSQRFEAALAVLADVVRNAAFPEPEFARKQKERLTALSQAADEAALVAGKALSAAVFGSRHPYGAPIEGTRAAIARLTCSDTLAAYRERLRPLDAFVLVVGDIDADHASKLLEARLGDWQPDGRAATPLKDAQLPRSARSILLVHKEGAAQAELRVGHSAPARDTADYFALSVLNTMLGGAFTSRLNTILRERMGVTYGAWSRFRFRRSGGLFACGSAVFSQAAARSAHVVVEEMERLMTEKVSADELRRAQSYIALGLPRSFESTHDIVARLREQLLYALADNYWQAYVDRIFSVTAADVLRVAARHLQPERCSIVVVADQTEVQHDLEQTGLGPVMLTRVAT